jgi:hypothetical protein
MQQGEARGSMPGATDTEIGQSMPYSGPASAYGMIGKGDMAYDALRIILPTARPT